MQDQLTVSLQAIRTDGWFERIGESIASFQALCDIVGDRFFAFSLITGARITSLTVDRRNTDDSVVEFSVVGDGISESSTEKLSLSRFRERVVHALLADEPAGLAPKRATDVEAIQSHIGVRYLLLAPIYGFSLRELVVDGRDSSLETQVDGVEKRIPLAEFRAAIRAMVSSELGRERKRNEGGIDLEQIDVAEAAAVAGEHHRVVEILGGWPAPLTIFMRTPEGQMLNLQTRTALSKALLLLTESYVVLGRAGEAEEVARISVQYSAETNAAGGCFAGLGAALLADDRAGEAIAAFRRAANLGGPGQKIWPGLAECFLQRSRFLASLAAIEEAKLAGVDADILEPLQERAIKAIGAPWQLYTETLTAAVVDAGNS